MRARIRLQFDLIFVLGHLAASGPGNDPCAGIGIAPIDPNAAGCSLATVVRTFRATVLAYNLFQALSHGVRSALFMDVTTPAVAATQFTACMAMSNLVTSYTAWSQGLSIVGGGYPVTLLIGSIDQQGLPRTQTQLCAYFDVAV